MTLFSLGTENELKKAKEAQIMSDFHNGKYFLKLVSTSNRETDYSELCNLKLVFQRQLSKMPKEYVVRQVFDAHNFNLILYTGNALVGGICYRPFFRRNFVEIVFCAIDYDFQVKGVGSFLMNCFKELVKSQMYGQPKVTNLVLEHIELCNLEINDLTALSDKRYANVTYPLYLMTYADNFAVGYFKKQGFTVNITFKDWIGYIKDYEGGTLVQCKLYWEINYLTKPVLIDKQRNKLFEDMKAVNECHIVRHVTDYTKMTKSSDIPGVHEDIAVVKPTREVCLRNFISFLLVDIKNNPSSWPFHEPVNPKEVPEYYSFTKNPIDLSAMIEKHNKGRYNDLTSFKKDIELMIDNCFAFNGVETQYYKCAAIIKEHFEKKLKFYKIAIDTWNLFSS